MRRLFIALLLLAAIRPLPVAAQDGNVLFPITLIEKRLISDTMVVLDARGSRAQGDRTQRVVLTYPDSSVMLRT